MVVRLFMNKNNKIPKSKHCSRPKCAMIYKLMRYIDQKTKQQKKQLRVYIDLFKYASTKQPPISALPII